MSHQRVAVLRGGPSSEYDVSMKTGQAVLAALDKAGFSSKDIVITKKGDWLDAGKVRQPEHALDAVDVVFIALHGEYGEDGQVQRILQRKGIPFTGSRALASGVAFNKHLTKETLLPHGILMPRHTKIIKKSSDNIPQIVDEVIETLGSELILKPSNSGSSHGMMHTADKNTLLNSLSTLLQRYDGVLIEEFIRGKEATVGILSDFRNQKNYILPVVEIVPPSGEPVFSYINKYNGQTKEVCPGRFSYREKTKLADTAAQVHDILNLSHYSRSDFIVRDGEVYFLEINTHPGLTDESLFPKAAVEVGLDFTSLITHLVQTARA